MFISYKRNVEPDEGLALRLHEALTEAGHKGFIDQTMKIGVAWAAEIQRQIEACDVMVVLLSEASAHSEMVAKEVEFAGRTGKRLLPVRINHPGPLPYQLSYILDPLQHAVWQTDSDRKAACTVILPVSEACCALSASPVASIGAFCSVTALWYARLAGSGRG